MMRMDENKSETRVPLDHLALAKRIAAREGLLEGATYLAMSREADRVCAVRIKKEVRPPEPDAATRLRMALSLRQAIALCEEAVAYLLKPVDLEAYIRSPPTELPGEDEKSMPVSAMNPAQ
jgi:hypothetical protein